MENGTKRTKKKFRYYDSYISKVLKIVSPSNGITSNAKQQLNSILIIISQIISDTSIELTRAGGKKTISEKQIEGAIRIVLSGELQERSVAQGRETLERIDTGVNNIRKGNSRQQKAGIVFAPAISERFLRQFGTSKTMVTAKSPFYLAAVIEYLASEMLELAVYYTTENKKVRITVRDLEFGIRNDSEFNKLFSARNITFMGGGVVPFIHPILLSKKRSKPVSTEENKKPKHKPGIVAIKEIKKYQGMYDCIVFARYPFEKFVRDIVTQYKPKTKISKNVFVILQYHIEQYLIKLLSQANLLAIHSKRVKLLPPDIDFIRSIKNNNRTVDIKVRICEEETKSMKNPDDETREDDELEDEPIEDEIVEDVENSDDSEAVEEEINELDTNQDED